MTILFPPTRSARPSLPRPFGLITLDGKVFRLFLKQAKVRHAVLSFLRISAHAYPKALNESKVEIRIQYRDVTQGIFKDISRNELVIRIQPSESIYLKINTKVPGLNTHTIPIEMDLTYKRRFAEAHIPEAYESLILDALRGDHSNFCRDDELDVAWRVSVHSLP